MRKFLLTLFILSSIQVMAQIPTNGLVGYYPFTGNAKDSSTNANHGTVYGATLTTDRLGRANHAYYFDSSFSDFIQIGTQNLLTNTFTYSLWANYDAIPYSGGIMFCIGIGSAGGDQGISMQNNYLGKSSGWCGGGYNTKPPMYPTQQASTSPAGKWYHVLMSRDTNCLSIYVDGVLLDTFSSATTRIPYYGNFTPEALIGMRPSNIQGFNGKIDDIRLYNRPLTKSEINALANENKLGIITPSKNHLISVYPNPASSDLHIILNDPPAGIAYKMRLYNTLGQEVLTQQITAVSNIIDLTCISAKGLYSVRVTDDSNHVIYENKLVLE